MNKGVIGIFIIVASLLIVHPKFVIGAAPVRVGVPSPSVSYFPVIVAARKGFFAQEGIPAEFIVMKPSIISAALSNGEIHFTTATGTAAGAILRGFPFKIVVYFSTRLMDSLVVKPQIKTVAELRGKIIGVDNSRHEFAAMAQFETAEASARSQRRRGSASLVTET